MESLLALSVLCSLPNIHHSLIWPGRRYQTLHASIGHNKRQYPYHQCQRTSWLSDVTTAVSLDGEVSLQHMTVFEIKELLRSKGHRVTGSKSELIQRLLTQQQQHPPSNDDTTTTKSKDMEDTAASNKIVIDPSLDPLPEPLVEALIRWTASSRSSAAALSQPTSPRLLPIQQKSYHVIAKGGDAVLFSPTGTGKSLGFILPLAARLWEWKHDGSLLHKKQVQKQHYIQQSRWGSGGGGGGGNGNDSLSTTAPMVVDAATPTILIVEPSRELARQVGKVFEKFHPTTAAAKGSSSSKRHVVTVYGGVPMTRHASMLGNKTDVVVGTPGRIRELIRENYLSTKHIRTIVLDEADTLLDFGDNPEVEWLLDGMANDYQLVLASATVNKRVEKFVGDVMELEIGEEGYVVVDGSGTNIRGGIVIDNGTTMDGAHTMDVDVVGEMVTANESKRESDSELNNVSQSITPTVRHWSMPASPASRITLTSDLIVTVAPRRGIVFVPTKAEVESVAQALAERLSAKDVSIHVLHGDMVQQARSRAIHAFRDDNNARNITRILIATDVAARGLDLPAVDLVLQYGVPRNTGKDGTYDSELYIHRTGRAGRYGNTRTYADAIVLYDRTKGETATLHKLGEEMSNLHGIVITPRQLPSPSEVMEASYERVMRLCNGAGTGTPDLVRYFAGKLSGDLIKLNDKVSHSRPSEHELFLIHRLATAMASLSGLDDLMPTRSLLTADLGDRTIRVWSDSCDVSSPLSPSVVTRLVKSLGSGKLGRILTCEDGSVVFDLGEKKAELLMDSVVKDPKLVNGWHFEMPVSLPTLLQT